MKTTVEIARRSAWLRSRDLISSGVRIRAKAWGGRPSAKQSRQAWKERGQ